MWFANQVYSDEPSWNKIRGQIEHLLHRCALFYIKNSWLVVVLSLWVSHLNLNLVWRVLVRHLLKKFWVKDFKLELRDNSCTLQHRLIWIDFDWNFVFKPLRSVGCVGRAWAPKLILAVFVDGPVDWLVVVFWWRFDWNQLKLFLVWIKIQLEKSHRPVNFVIGDLNLIEQFLVNNKVVNTRLIRWGGILGFVEFPKLCIQLFDVRRCLHHLINILANHWKFAESLDVCQKRADYGQNFWWHVCDILWIHLLFVVESS